MPFYYYSCNKPVNKRKERAQVKLAMHRAKDTCFPTQPLNIYPNEKQRHTSTQFFLNNRTETWRYWQIETQRLIFSNYISIYLVKYPVNETGVEITRENAIDFAVGLEPSPNSFKHQIRFQTGTSRGFSPSVEGRH